MKRSSDGSACACALLTKANMKLIPAIRHLLGAFSLPLVIAGLSTLASCATQKSSVALGSNGTDIVNHPEHHIGDHVTIRGKVKNVYSHGSFTVGPEGFLKLDLPVLARGPETSVPPLHEGDRVEIEGVVRTFTQRDFLGGYSTGFYGIGSAYPMTGGFYGLGTPGVYPGYYGGWEGQPMIIAHRVEKL
jgi:hypothetical protein